MDPNVSFVSEIFSDLLSTGHEQDGTAADDWQDDCNDHENRLHQIRIVALSRGYEWPQSLDPTALSIVALHTAAEQRQQIRQWMLLNPCYDDYLSKTCFELYSHAHWLCQSLYVFAVAMNAEAQVGGGAGVLSWGESGSVPPCDVGVLRVERSDGFAPLPVLPLAFALPLPPLIFISMRLCEGKE